MKRIFTVLFALSILSNVVKAQITWNFATSSPSSGVPTDVTVGVLAQGNNNGSTTLLSSSSVSSGYTGASGTNNAGAAAFTGSLSTTTSTYFTFTVSVAVGKTVSFTDISFGSRRTATGPQAFAIRVNTDNYSTSTFTDPTQTVASTWELKSGTFNTPITISDGGSVTFRIYGYNGTGTPAAGTANWRIDDLKLTNTTVLPVTLTSFTANKAGAANQLTWATATEQNTAEYVVERSRDAQNFVAIGKVSAQGKSASYNFTDATPLSISYYRLRAIDYDGKETTSKTVSVSRNSNGLKVYPTLVADNITIAAEGENSFNIINLLGQVLISGNFDTQKEISTATLPRGTYFVSVAGATVKFVKE